MDIYSRKIVGWQVYQEESSALAADLLTDICAREGVERYQVTLHSDNGSPMKGATIYVCHLSFGAWNLRKAFRTFQMLTLYSAAALILAFLCKNVAKRNTQKCQNERCPLEYLVSLNLNLTAYMLS